MPPPGSQPRGLRSDGAKISALGGTGRRHTGQVPTRLPSSTSMLQVLRHSLLPSAAAAAQAEKHKQVVCEQDVFKQSAGAQIHTNGACMYTNANLQGAYNEAYHRHAPI